MLKMRVFSPRLLPLLILLFAVAAFAQTSANIQGTVTDPSGAAVVGAKVTVKNPASGIERTTQTGSTGAYEVAALPPGTYSVQVQMAGFETQLAKDVVLAVSQNSVQNFSVKVASTSEVVTVEATAAVVETTTMTVGQVINQRTVQEIPLNGRHFVDLGLLIPGSVTPPQNGTLTAPLRGQGSFAFNTAGNREDTVNFMVNGINLNDMVQNQITFQPSINTVSEFKVDNSTYSAEYGRNSGAIVNIATRSGSNAFHGEAFEFLRNNWLDARNFFNTRFTTSATPTPIPQDVFKRNQFGAAVGGPIFKDKTFFFASYEGLRQRQGINLNTNVLSNAQRTQVLSGASPVSASLLKFIPVANSGANGFQGSATAPVNIDQGTVDISHQINTNLRLHGYYAIQHDLRQEPILQGDNIPNFGDTRESKRQIATLNLDQTLSSSMVNEVRVGFNRIHITFTPNDLTNPVSLGIQNGNNFNSGLPQIQIQNQAAIGCPPPATVCPVNTIFGGPGGFPQARGDTTAVLSDTFSYLRGKHSLKFGGEFRRFYNNNVAGDDGTLVFSSVASFAAGTSFQYNMTPGNTPSRIATGELGFFAQDSWKVWRRMTLELGLRYDWNQTPTEALNRFSNFTILTPATTTTPGLGNLVPTSSPYKQNNLNFQPRLGFAYDVFGNQKTILRSGYAVLTDQPITNLVTGLTGNPPFASPKQTNGQGYANLLNGSAVLSPVVVDPNFSNSYIQSYNLNVQQQLASKWSLMVGYFGSKGTHLRTRENLNQFIRNGAGTLVRPYQFVNGDPLRPLGNISENVSNGNSSYNALWITSNLNSFHGLQFNASYTFSKSLDYTSQNGQVINLQNSLNPRGDRGLSDYDARNRFSMNFIYALPFKGNRFFEGWQVGSIIQMQSGNPVNLIANNFNVLTGTSTLRVDQVGPIQILNSPIANSPNIQYFNASAFALPGTAANSHFGNFGRNVLIGPGFQNIDFSLIKKTKISERLTHEFRFESFDLLNHANLGQPGRALGLSTFGVITSTRFPTGDSGSARQLQFAMKLIF